MSLTPEEVAQRKKARREQETKTGADVANQLMIGFLILAAIFAIPIYFLVSNPS